MRCSFLYTVLFLLCVVSNTDLFGATIYVDQTLANDITDGSYDRERRDNSGSDGDAYNTIQEAINAMEGGDDIIVRGGTYDCSHHIHIPTTKNGTADNWSSLKSYPGEWAILDGKNATTCDYNCEADGGGAVIGFAYWTYDTSADLKYWWFERLEIKNGRSANPEGNAAAGFFGNGGPFRFRYCYIHDCQADAGNQNPGGLKGFHWQDSIVEYCWLADNGIVTPDMGDNPGNIVLYGDYLYNDTPVDGFDDYNVRRPTARNEIRYNYITGSNVGIKYKGGQFFTGRNPEGGHGWDDTYKAYGDKIHHNIITGASAFGIASQQDFHQIYNNILEDCQIGIAFRYQPSTALYKAVSYNNSILNPTKAAIIRFGNDIEGINDPHEVYGWDLNNIFDQCGPSSFWCTQQTLSVIPFGSTCSSGFIFDLSKYYGSNNYFYRPEDSLLIRLNDRDYTASEYESNSETGSPKTVYTNSYNSDNPIYLGTFGAYKYITNGSHVIQTGLDVSEAGIGGIHPYLSGTLIPSYVGATDPDDHTWVAGVLGLASISYLRNVSGEPDWGDSDEDEILDYNDNCPRIKNPGQEDGDGDGCGDACDGRPDDPDWVTISGFISFGDSTPLCAMVLANGQYIYTCGDTLGIYDLDVPLDEYGGIALYGFCSGFSPFKIILGPERPWYYDIAMTRPPAGSKKMKITVQTDPGTTKPGWVRINGTASYDGIPLCSMILANGQKMFSCGVDLGTFDLEVPLDEYGEITFYDFCSGFEPYKEVFVP